MRGTWTLLLGLTAAVACDVPGAPAWTADYLFPLDFPSVDLSGVPGGVIPINTVSFTTPIVPQSTDGLVGEILFNENLAGLRAEVILSTTLAVTGNVSISIAPSRADLFNTRSLTTTLGVAPGADTTFVAVDLDTFRNAPALYFQSQVAVAGQGGSIPVPPGSEIGLRVNFIGTVRVSQ